MTSNSDPLIRGKVKRVVKESPHAPVCLGHPEVYPRYRMIKNDRGGASVYLSVGCFEYDEREEGESRG